jgi:hypothetical protein
MKNISVYMPKKISTKIGRQILLGRKNSPTILFAAGVVGVVATTVVASRATLKLEDVLEKAQENLNAVNSMAKQERKDYTHEDAQKDTVYIYARTTVDIVKLYAPTVLLGAASIACLAGSHNILSQRNASLMAAYAALDQTFSKYRERVISAYTLEHDAEQAKLADDHFMYGSEERKVLDAKTGKEVVVRRVGAGLGGGSMYARYFDKTNRNWEPTPDYNRIFLTAQQNYFNNLLISRGHVFLNDVYDALGLERSSPGSIVGWVVGEGDNFIDFGIFNGKNQAVRDFVNGYEDSILLDFNVDGIIYDKI